MTIAEATDIINSGFFPGTVNGGDPAPAKRNLNVRSVERIQYNSQGLYSTTQVGIGPSPVVDSGLWPFYYGQWTFTSQLISGVTAAGDYLEMIAEVPVAAALVTEAYNRRVRMPAGLTLFTTVVDVERSIPMLFQNFRINRVPGGLEFYSTFTFNGHRIVWS